MEEIFFVAGKNLEIDEIVKYRVMFVKEFKSGISGSDEERLVRETKEYIERRYKNGEYIAVFGRVGDVTVCCAGLLLYELPPITGKWRRVTGHVLNFYTLPEYRRRGYGESMMRFIRENCKDWGIDRLYLNATPDGEKTYRKCGFSEKEEPSLTIEDIS